ncbi:MAG TPA: SdpI family protein [Tepidiformaceae bacterium]|nr:SdpI family protein [Tepidiformaceae bacterium]
MWVGFLAVTVGGGILLTLGLLGLLEKLPPNHFAGIRTKYTLSTPEVWYAVHRAGAPVLVFSGVAVFSVGMAFLPFAITGNIPSGLGAIVLAALAVFTLGSVVASWRNGVTAARKELG